MNVESIEPHELVGKEREIAEKMARQLGTLIPGDIRMEFWSLPVLQRLIGEFEHLRRTIDRVEGLVVKRK